MGKTSIIESVHALGVSKSHKAISDLEMIKYDADFCFVKGNFIDSDDNKKTEVVCSITQQGKQIVKNGKKIICGLAMFDFSSIHADDPV